MKNTFKFLGIIALVAIIGFTFTACDEEDGKSSFLPSLQNTTWNHITDNAITIAFSKDKATVSGYTENFDSLNGTYTIYNSNLDGNGNHVYNLRHSSNDNLSYIILTSKPDGSDIIVSFYGVNDGWGNWSKQ